MNQDMGIQISSGGGFVRVVVAADFTAAAGPAQGSA
jgi:hypothetical protein